MSHFEVITDKTYTDAKWRAILADGLRMANKGNTFWTKSDAMQALAQYHVNKSRGV